jgi:tetratricopeptide (TPR) repeat protein
MNAHHFIKKIEDQKFSFLIGFLTFFAIILCRNILESVFEGTQILGFSPINSHSFYMIFVHFPLFYISIFLWILFVFMSLTKEDWIKVSKTLLLGMAVIIVTPIIDIIVSKGSGYNLTYLRGFEEFTEIHRFFDFTKDLIQASWGQRIEILLVLIGGFIYVLIKTKNYFKSAIASILIYFIIFLHGVLPNTIAKIPSYFGAHLLSFKTIITNGILTIDSQNYAVIFSLSIILIGFFILRKGKKELTKKIFNFSSSGISIIVLCLGIVYGIALISPYYTFIFYNPISYLIFLLALLTCFIVNAAALSNRASVDLHILTVTGILFAVALGPVFLIFIAIFFLIKKLPHLRWLALIPCFCAGFALIFQEASFKTIIPIDKKAIEIKGRKLAGWCYFLNTDYKQALDEYTGTYLLCRDDEILKRIGQCHLNLGDLNKGIELLEEIPEPDYETILSLGQAYTQKGKHTRAIEVYKKAIERNVEPAEFFIKIAQIASREGLEKEMSQALEKSLLYGNSKYKIFQIKGDFYLGKGDKKRALKMYTKALHYNSRAVKALAGLGLIYYQQGNIKSAEEQFLRALNIEPNNDALYNNLGALYFITKEYEKAEQLFKKSIKKNPNQTEAFYNLGLIYEKEGRIEHALAMYHKVLKVNPSYAPAQRKIEEIKK